MKYKKIYDEIIQNRQKNPVEGYTENHHIKPRCLGGTLTVALTAREHFICHYLLTKMYKHKTNEWYKMIHAFKMMKCVGGDQQRYFNSFLYESQRKYFSEVMSRSQLGEKNSQFGSVWISNIELKQNKKINKGIEIPVGWVKGRSVWNKIVKHRLKKYNQEKRKEIRDKAKIKREKYALYLYEIYKKEKFTSMSEFVKSKYYGKTRFALRKLWQLYLPEFVNSKRGLNFQ